MKAHEDSVLPLQTATLSGLPRRSGDPNVTSNLQSYCPVCNNAYKAGEGVLALACLPIAISGLPWYQSVPADSETSKRIILGHQECVLPRLLTLLAGFQPEARFVKTSNAFFANESTTSECQHGQS